MKITERKTAAKHDDFLTSVARSIGSTLGAVAAKVDRATRPARRRPSTGRKRARKPGSVSRVTRRVSASAASKRSHAAARLTTRKRKKSSK
jgi:hypothetical protein